MGMHEQCLHLQRHDQHNCFASCDSEAAIMTWALMHPCAHARDCLPLIQNLHKACYAAAAAAVKWDWTPLIAHAHAQSGTCTVRHMHSQAHAQFGTCIVRHMQSLAHAQ